MSAVASSVVSMPRGVVRPAQPAIFAKVLGNNAAAIVLHRA